MTPSAPNPFALAQPALEIAPAISNADNLDPSFQNAEGDCCPALKTDGAQARQDIIAASAPFREGRQLHTRLLNSPVGHYRIGMNEVAIGLTVPRFAVEIARQRLTTAYFSRGDDLGNGRAGGGRDRGVLRSRGAGSRTGAYCPCGGAPAYSCECDRADLDYAMPAYHFQ
jgi:hypothetical protein